MVLNPKEKLIKELIDEGYLKSPGLIEAFKAIDRIDFVLEERKEEAYGNYPLPIGHGQTISQPLTVAFMLELLEPKKGEKILDIGSGSGWTAALLAHLVWEENTEGKVVAIERIPELADMARQNIGKYNFIERGVVRVLAGDGSRGVETEAPFHKIIAAAAGEEIPNYWKEQLKIGGRIVAPVKNSIYTLDKESKDVFSEKHYFGFSFVPLVKG